MHLLQALCLFSDHSEIVYCAVQPCSNRIAHKIEKGMVPAGGANVGSKQPWR